MNADSPISISHGAKLPAIPALDGVRAIAITLVIGAVDKGVIVQRVLSSSPARIIWDLSYGTYLWHMPIIYFIRYEMLPTELSPTPTFAFMMWNCTLITLLISQLSFVFIEPPFLRQPVTIESPDNHGALQH